MSDERIAEAGRIVTAGLAEARSDPDDPCGWLLGSPTRGTLPAKPRRKQWNAANVAPHPWLASGAPQIDKRRL